MRLSLWGHEAVAVVRRPGGRGGVAAWTWRRRDGTTGGRRVSLREARRLAARISRLRAAQRRLMQARRAAFRKADRLSYDAPAVPTPRGWEAV